MDRGLPGILVEPIGQEFGLSDAQRGLITGTSFGLAFGLAVIPMGLLSDRTSRKRLLAAVFVFWSLCTALGGLARQYSHLLLARVGVGLGESAAVCTATPMISDIFPPRARAFTFGILYMSANLGVFLASSIGGWVAAHHGWRAAFL